MTTLRDMAICTEAADCGVSIFDRRDRAALDAQSDWLDLIEYLESAP